MGKSTKAFMFVGLGLVILVGGKVIQSATRHEDDKTLIQRALAESIQASKEGRPGGVMDKLSDNLKFNGQNEGGNQNEIARYIRSSKPDVTVDNTDPVVDGDEAKIVSPVTLTLSLLGQSTSRHMKEVTIVFRKEESREWLFIPTRRWKLAEVQVPESSVADLSQSP